MTMARITGQIVLNSEGAQLTLGDLRGLINDPGVTVLDDEILLTVETEEMPIGETAGINRLVVGPEMAER